MSFRRRKQFPVPVLEEVDLKVIVSVIPLKNRFDYISRIIWAVVFASNTVLYTSFGADPALTKGVQIKYIDNFLLPHGIKSNGEFSETSYDTRIDTDATGTKINYLTSRLSFTKFTKDGVGLKIDAWRNLFLVVQDDLSGSANTHIIATVEGWRI